MVRLADRTKWTRAALSGACATGLVAGAMTLGPDDGTPARAADGGATLVGPASGPAARGAAPNAAGNPADDAPRPPPQLGAAMGDAVGSLRRDVLSVPLAGDVTVRDLVDATGSAAALADRVESAAEQRGGTRWRNDETCEVLLELSGAEVADVLTKAAAARPENVRRLGVAPDVLERALGELRGQRFAAVGMSVGAGDLGRLRPEGVAAAGPWRAVSDARRREALMAAKGDAVARVVDSLRTIDMGNGKRVGDALAGAPAAANEVRTWVGGRPVNRVQFGDDLTVQVSLDAPPDELWPVVESALVHHKLGPPAQDPAWDRVRRDVLQGAAPAVGRAAAAPDAAAAAAPNAQPAAPDRGPVALPLDPPAWVARQIDVEGKAEGRGLLAARAAEDDALRKLRARLDALPLTPQLTLGQAAQRDPRVAGAVDRALRRTTPTRVEYGPGTVTVRMSLFPDRVWAEMVDGR